MNLYFEALVFLLSKTTTLRTQPERTNSLASDTGVGCFLFGCWCCGSTLKASRFQSRAFFYLNGTLWDWECFNLSLFMMEQSSTQSPFIRTVLKILRFIGIYLISAVIIYFLGRQNLLTNLDLNPIVLLLGYFIALPLVWALAKNFFAGFARYALLIGLLLIVNRVIPESNSPNTSNDSDQGQLNYIGTYAADENGVQVKVVTGPNKWYGEVIEGTTGRLISSEGGEVNNKLLYDEYGNEIGEFQGSSLNVTIQGQRVRLKKE